MIKKKIAFVIHSLTDGGAERVVSILSNYFNEKYSVVIITLVEEKVFYKINKNIPVYNVKNSNKSKNIASALVNNLTTVYKIKSIIRAEEIDLLISFTTSVNVLSILSVIGSPVPCIISERNNAKVVPPNLFWQSLRNFFYKYSNYLVVQTNGNKSFYKKLVNDSKIKVIQNPLETTIAKHTKVQEKNTYNILSVGRLTANKAHHIIILALYEITDLNWELKIVGDGPELKNLIELTSKLNLQNRVIFTGQVSNVSKFYEQSDLFVFASRSEGFPNALMEAYAHGIPCISSNCDFGPRDIISHAKDGLLFPVDDIKELEIAIRSLLTNIKLREKFSINAIKNTRRFELNYIGSKWNDLIGETLISE